MNTLVIGATGGTGRLTTQALAAEGHRVTAFARSAETLSLAGPLISPRRGDATDRDAVRRAVAGQDAVVVTLGIAENPLRVRLAGPSRTPSDIRSRGTSMVIEAMEAEGVRRLVVLSSFGVGPTRSRLGLSERLLFALLLAPQIQDTERQEQRVRQSGLDWTLVQPVHLNNEAEEADPFVSAAGDTATMNVSRQAVARVIAQAIGNPLSIGKTLAVSAARPAPKARRHSVEAQHADA